mgnify:CR=1 FL=1
MNSNDTSIDLQDEFPELSDEGGLGSIYMDWLDGFPQEEQTIDFDFSEYCNSSNGPPSNSSNDPPCHSQNDSGGRVDPFFYDLSNVVDENPIVAFCHNKVLGYECSKGSTSIDAKLNDAMLCNGKKLSIEKKTAIFNFALEKLNAKGSGSTINRLNRNDTRRKERMNNRVKEVLPYLESLKEKGPLSDFKELLRIVHPISNL